MSIQELVRLKDVPAYQNKMYETAEAARACSRGDVILIQSHASGLVYNHAFEPHKLNYDESYQNEQNHSPAFQAHIHEALKIVGRHLDTMSILEIGCGKGAFLELMRSVGYNARGIDPAYEGNSQYIVRDHFEPNLGIRDNGIVMRHVLEHIPNPFQFLVNVLDANGGNGLIYIEVPCLEWILQHRVWFDIFYEHVNYFRLADFERMFGHILESGYLFGGQYLFIVAKLDSLRDPTDVNLGTPNEVKIPENFFASIDNCVRAIRQGARRAVWGAAAKGVMFTHHMSTRNLVPEIAIDINPGKHGKFLAGSGLPVLNIAEALAYLEDTPDIFVMNSNYVSEIQAMGGRGPNYIAVDQI